MTDTVTTAENLIDRFDAGEDVLDYFDVGHPLIEKPEASSLKQVSVSMNANMVAALDAEAERVGVSRQAVIKMWLQERIDSEEDRRSRRVSVA